MSLHLNKSMSLVELIIAVSLLSVVVLAFSSIELFSRHHLLSVNKRTQIQNNISYVLEHMAKEIIDAMKKGRL